jgi:formylmethanofuran dehydrogenase subunit E-like metal-binding protein
MTIVSTTKTKKVFTGHVEFDLEKTDLQEILTTRPQLQTEGLMNPSLTVVFDVFQATLTDITAKGG